MNTDTLKTELGRIRGAITSGSFDRDTALDALGKAEACLSGEGVQIPAAPLTKANPPKADKEAAKHA